MDISNAAWDKIDKAKLPWQCYLWVENKDLKTTWHLPVYEGVGEINAETGRYRERGPLNLNALRAASAAVAGARSGKPMDLPMSVKGKLNQLLKENDSGVAAFEAGERDDQPNLDFFWLLRLCRRSGQAECERGRQ